MLFCTLLYDTVLRVFRGIFSILCISGIVTYYSFYLCFGVTGKIKPNPQSGNAMCSRLNSVDPATHRPLSSSFLGFPYRILQIKPQKGTT